MTDLTLDHTTHIRIQKPANELENELIKFLTAEERTAVLLRAGEQKRDRLTAANAAGDQAFSVGKQYVFFLYTQMVSEAWPPRAIDKVLNQCIGEAKKEIKKRHNVPYYQGMLTAAIDHQKKLAEYEMKAVLQAGTFAPTEDPH